MHLKAEVKLQKVYDMTRKPMFWRVEIQFIIARKS